MSSRSPAPFLPSSTVFAPPFQQGVPLRPHTTERAPREDQTRGKFVVPERIDLCVNIIRLAGTILGIVSVVFAFIGWNKGPFFAPTNTVSSLLIASGGCYLASLILDAHKHRSSVASLIIPIAMIVLGSLGLTKSIAHSTLCKSVSISVLTGVFFLKCSSCFNCHNDANG